MRQFFALMSLAFLFGCTAPENIDYHDRDARLTPTDFRNELAPRAPAMPVADEQETAPDFILPATVVPNEEEWRTKRITLNIDGSTPIKDLFAEIAQQAKLDLEIDPAITAPPVIFKAKSQPLPDVIERLSAKAGVRAEVKKNTLRVEADTPYLASYRVDYPNIARSTTNNISSSLNIASTEQGGSSNKNDSAMSTDGKSESDFWAELSANITQILDKRDGNAQGATFSINKQSGIVTVKGTQRQHKTIAEYLSMVSEAAQAQVLIEARILEVQLNDSFSSGINWNTLFGGALEFGFNAPAGIPTVVASPVPSSAPGLSLNVTNTDFQGLFNFLQNFGTVRALSSPRMTVMQNQVGVIKVVRNEVYFRLTIQTTDATNNSPSRRDVTSEQRTIPVGLIMNVQPSIDKETGRVTLALRPTITRVAGRRTDPGILIAASDAGLSPSQIDSTVPVVAVQEMDSVVSMQTGQTLVMGGLMRDETTSTTEGIPGTAEVPLVKYLTNAKDDETSKAELVVFLKASIVKSPAATINPTDRDLYYRFGRDTRPIKADPASETNKAIITTQPEQEAEQ